MHGHTHFRSHRHCGSGFGIVLLVLFLLVFGGFLLKTLFWLIPLAIIVKVLMSMRDEQEKRKNDDFDYTEKPKRRTFEDGTPIV